MSTIMNRAGEKVHERIISISTYAVDEGHMIVTGRLHEKRLKDFYLFTGEKRPSGDLHDMTIRLFLTVPDLVIEDLEVDMTTVPREGCVDITSALDAVKGLKIESGFLLKLRSLFYGVKGCTHLTHLLLTMAPAIMQGLWAYNSQNPPLERPEMRDPDRIKGIAEGLKNSCYAWREDGLAYKRLKKIIDGDI